MKRIIITTLCLIMATASFAQNPQGPQGAGRPEGPNVPPQNEKWAEKIQAEKIAFFTNELDLTPEEAQVFWPVYNQYWKENMEAHEATMKAFRTFAPKKDGSALSGKELETAVDTYVKTSSKENEILSKYYPKFKKVLPIEKVSKLFLAEEAFRMKMIRGLREPREPRESR